MLWGGMTLSLGMYGTTGGGGGVSHALVKSNTLWPASSCVLLLELGRCGSTNNPTHVGSCPTKNEAAAQTSSICSFRSQLLFLDAS